ncbi:MAG: metallophosphoesterase [Alphaproteobacteria bacterium]|nr:metallophosphoesterase [Alphaproteobacteria bacterium]
MSDKEEKPVPPGAKLEKGKVVPLSENERKFKKDWDANDCIAELRGIAEANPDKVITRNFFRVHSRISESTWNRYFGTFSEFKRQANITLSRHAHRVERAIAKHASVDTQRVMNLEKSGWAGAYLKPNGKRFKTILVGSDVHDVDCDPFWRRCFIDTARRAQPEIVCLNGDIFDLPEFSKYTQDPREFEPVKRIEWVHAFLKDIREVSPDSEIWLIEGNHEFRLLRHLSEATPALKTVLADLHGFTVPKLLGLDAFQVNYVSKSDLTAFNERDIKREIANNWHCFYDAVIAHHFPEGRQMGFPGWNGHHHKHIVWPGYNPRHRAYEWHQIGCGHARDASYCNAERWSNGFLLAHIDTQNLSTAFDYVSILDHAVIGGQWYERAGDEFVTRY